MYNSTEGVSLVSSGAFHSTTNLNSKIPASLMRECGSSPHLHHASKEHEHDVLVLLLLAM
jgi:hypothetical protein